MQSPFVVGILSIIPGLGFFVLGQPKRGIGAIGIIVGLFISGFFIPGEFLSQLSFQLLALAWIGQIYFAVQTANLLKKQKSGEIVAPRETMPVAPAPQGLSANEKLAYKMRETVRQQLNIGEHLLMRFSHKPCHLWRLTFSLVQPPRFQQNSILWDLQKKRSS